MRVNVRAENINQEGFNLIIETEKGSKINYIEVAWIACPLEFDL